MPDWCLVVLSAPVPGAYLGWLQTSPSVKSCLHPCPVQMCFRISMIVFQVEVGTGPVCSSFDIEFDETQNTAQATVQTPLGEMWARVAGRWTQRHTKRTPSKPNRQEITERRSQANFHPASDDSDDGLRWLLFRRLARCKLSLPLMVNGFVEQFLVSEIFRKYVER